MLESSLTRRQALALLVGAAGLTACSGSKAWAGVAVGSKNFTEELLLGEMYSQLCEHHGLAVTRKLNLGGTNIAMASILRGEIDVYPEYTGTALLAELKLPPILDRVKAYRTVAALYKQRYHLIWLRPAPMNDTQALATTQHTASRLNLHTLSQCSHLAPQLRLGAVPEFTDRPDGLPGLQKTYGGFRFASITLIDIGLKYTALLEGRVDVVVAFGTDGQISADRLVILQDDRHFFPAYQVAPVVREGALLRHPAMRGILDPLAPHLTDDTMRRLNWLVDGRHQEPADVAAAFLHDIGLVST